MNNKATCHPERIELFLGQKLTNEEQAAFELHLNDCDDCRRRLEATAAGDDVWSGVRDALRGEPPPADCLPSGDSALDSATGGDASFSQATVLSLLAPTDDDRMIGRLGTYEVVGVIGSGGMGVVLKAFDAALNRYVAIKILAPHLGSSGAARKRFSREAQAAAAVVHDNVMEIYGVADAGGLPYLVMPYVRGPSLQRRLDKDGPLALVEILRIGMQAASGLAAAHAQGLVHRDVKPANILLADGVERVKLTDFGLARAADDASLTKTGIIAGTPQYMSPEQARGESVDYRSDLFSLGSVLYAMCTGRAPFRAETSYGMLRRVTDTEPRPIRHINPDIPQWLCRIIARLMAKQPGDRFQSAGEVAELLEECLAHAQQPAAVPLPASLVPPSNRSRNFSISWRSLGVLVMLAALGMGLLGMVLWQGAAVPDANESQSTSGGAIRSTSLAEAIRVFNARAKDDRIGQDQPPLTEDEVIAAVRWSLLEKDKLPVSDQTRETLSRIVDSRELPQGFELEVLTRFQPNDQIEVTKWSVRLRIPAEPNGTTCISIREVPITSRVFGPEERKVIQKWQKRWQEQGGIAGFDMSQYDKERAAAAERDRSQQSRGGESDERLWNEFGVTPAPVSPSTAKMLEYMRTPGSTTDPTSATGSARPQPKTTTAVPRRLDYFTTGNSVTIAFSADGKRIAVANGNPTRVMQSGGTSRVKDNWKPTADILDAETGKIAVSLKIATDGEDAVIAATPRVTHVEATALAFSPDGKVVAVGTSIGQVKLFDARTGELLRSLDDQGARLADKETPESWKPLRRAMGSVASLAFSPDGSLLATCGRSFSDFSVVFDAVQRYGRTATGPGRLKLWEVQTGTLKHDLAGHSHAEAVAFSPDGHLLASAGLWASERDNGTGVILWNPHTGMKIRTLMTSANGGTRSVAFSPDGKLLAIATLRFDKDKAHNASTGAVSLIHAASGITDWLVTVPGWARPVTFSPDGNSVAVLCGGRSIRFLEVETGTTMHEIQSPDSPQAPRWTDFAISPQAHTLAIGTVDRQKKGGVELWNLDAPDLPPMLPQ